MKWLLLILLVSCGKEEMPKAIDLRDADGDQIINAEEINDDVYIADFTPINEINGQLSFASGTVVKKEFFLKKKNQSGKYCPDHLFFLNGNKDKKHFELNYIF